MSSISLLKGQKEVLQIEFSRIIGLRYAVQFIRNVRRLLLRSNLLRITALILFAVCVVAYTLFAGQDKITGTGWLAPDTCVAEDCRVKQPLLSAELSPNLLLVLIHSSAGGKTIRDAIRKTWVSGLTNDKDTPIQYRFVLGGQEVYSSLLENIQEESVQYNDIVLLPDVTDSLLSLTHRTIKSFKHVHLHLNRFSYVLKCDDDSLVDVLRVASELQQREQTDRLYWGYMNGATRLYWFGVYREYNWFICDTYTPYALGGGYVLSMDLVQLLALNEAVLKPYRCEDAALGSWLAPYNVEYKHDSRFNTNTPSRGCKDPYLVVHKVSPSDMFSYHNSYQQENRYCSWRTTWHSAHGHLYNWRTLPSQCCYANPALP